VAIRFSRAKYIRTGCIGILAESCIAPTALRILFVNFPTPSGVG
jgi:hypothetical protein